MRIRSPWCLLLLTVNACVADAPLPLAPPNASLVNDALATSSTWTVRDIGLDPEYSSTVGWAISNRGQIAGFFGMANRPTRAFTQHLGGSRVLLRALPNDSGTFAHAINSAGIAVGESLRGYFSLGRPVAWFDRGQPFVIPGPDSGFAEDISDGGWIVGTAAFPTSIQQGFRWRSDRGLELLPGDGFYPFSRAHAVNDDGLVAGDAAGPALWTPAGSLLRLPLPPGAVNGIAVDVNNAGEVGGFLTLADFTLQAFKWTRAQGMTVLPQPPGMTNSIVIGIDKRGRVYGMAAPAGGFNRPFVWEYGVPIALPKPGFNTALYGVNACGIGVGANIHFAAVSTVVWLTDC